MWRSLKQIASQFKIPKKEIRHYSRIPHPSKSREMIVVIVAGAGLTSAVVYSKYNSKLNSMFDGNIPFIDKIYKFLPDINQSQSFPPKTSIGSKDISALPSNKFKSDEKTADKTQNFKAELKAMESSFVKGSIQKTVDKNINELKSDSPEQIDLSGKLVPNPRFNKNLLIDMIKLLESSCDETLITYKEAARAIRKHMKLLNKALTDPDSSSNSNIWEQAYIASNDRHAIIKKAENKAAITKTLIDKLKTSVQDLALEDPKNQSIKMCEDVIEKVNKELNNSETKIKEVENETNLEYQDLFHQHFGQKLQNMLPNYVYGLNNSKSVSTSDLKVIIAHAHQRIEHLQKQLAKQQVLEKIRLDDALRHQKLKQDSTVKGSIEAELEKRDMEIKIAVDKKMALLKENYEYELGNLLQFQTAAHLDHIQEILKINEQRLERKFSLDFEEKLLQMKGILISDISDSMARMKEIQVFLETKAKLDIESRKAQALWLSCQALSEKISSASNNLNPLEADIALIKLSALENNAYVNTVLAGIPSEALTRGIYSPEVLKQRFFGVKNVCQKVAIINENNDSLYHYLLSYIQSFLIIDEISIPNVELENKMAVDPKEWDTFDILSRISYSLKTDNFEQALRYANQLKGEAKDVASDWMKELKLFLETKIAVKALSTYSAAINVKAYH